MMEGGRRYGTYNYREAGVRFSVYFDACQRHLHSFKEGEDIDPNSRIHHLMKAAACLVVLRDSMLLGNWEDDRPIRSPLDMDALNAQAAKIIEMYPECEAPFTELRKRQEESESSP
jgi:hypothetical protein